MYNPSILTISEESNASDPVMVHNMKGLITPPKQPKMLPQPVYESHDRHEREQLYTVSPYYFPTKKESVDPHQGLLCTPVHINESSKCTDVSCIKRKLDMELQPALKQESSQKRQRSAQILPTGFETLYQSPLYNINKNFLTIDEKFLDIEKALSKALMTITYGEPVTHVYNPLEYAWAPHTDFVKKYCRGTKEVLFLGMNPGPFGMAQTGVPFGLADLVKNWLQISGLVGKPVHEHPKRPIVGFECTRNEVSGARFWGLWQKLCGTPATFFHNSAIYNICPLVFMSKSGKNVTPPQLQASQRNLTNFVCDQALCDIVRLLDIKIIIGIGNFAQDRARKALRARDEFKDIRIEKILHPSPRSPAANKGWESVALKMLQDLNVMQYFQEQKVVAQVVDAVPNYDVKSEPV